MYGQCQAVNELPDGYVHASLICLFDTLSCVLRHKRSESELASVLSDMIIWYNTYRFIRKIYF